MAVIFFDIDGTLAVGTAVPQSAAEAVAKTRTLGNLVFICTGRPLRYARANFGVYADGFVCSNGRLAVHGDEVVINRPISAKQTTAIADVLDSFGVGYAFCGLDDLFYGGNPKFRQLAKDVNGPSRELSEAMRDGTDLYNFDIYFDDPAQRDGIAAKLDDLCLVNPHGPHPSADVTVLGYGKGDAVRDITAALGMQHENSYAFGDGINDLSMVKMAGHGVAMGNAVPELKAAASYVTSDICNDGVANGLAHLGLV